MSFSTADLGVKNLALLHNGGRLVLGPLGSLLFLVIVVVNVSSSDGQSRLDGSLVQSPACKGVLGIDDDLLGGLVAVVGGSRLTGGDGGVVEQLEQSLTVAGNQSELLGVLSDGVKLVVESGLDLLSGDVGELGLSDKGLSLGSDKLLLKNNNLGGVGLLVLEVGNLVGDLLLSVSRGLDGSLNVSHGLQGDSVLVVLVDELVLELTNLVDENTELVGDVGDILVSVLTPERQLLGNLSSLSGLLLDGSHHVLLHLDELGELSGEIGAHGAGGGSSERVDWVSYV